MYYTSVFAYALRSLAQNEFYSPTYEIFPYNATGTAVSGAALNASAYLKVIKEPQLAPVDYYTAHACATWALGCGSDTYGTESLKKLNINLEPGWKWGGVGFLFGFVVLMNWLSGIALGKVYIERNIGTSRTKDEEEPAAEGEEKGAAAAEERAVVEVTPPGTSSVLPFSPMTVTWRDLKYTVELNNNLGGGFKTLLQGVTGIAIPGRLISLMVRYPPPVLTPQALPPLAAVAPAPVAPHN